MQGPVNNGFVRLFLKDKSERERIAAADRGRPAQRCSGSSPAVRVNITQEASIGERRAQRDRRATSCCRRRTLDGLREGAAEVPGEARESPAFTFVDSDLKFSKPEVRVSVRSRQGSGARRQRARHRADAAGLAERPALRISSSTTASSTT